jgi:hypothetical protein
MNGNGHGIVVGYEYVLKEQGQRVASHHATGHVQGSASSAISLLSMSTGTALFFYLAWMDLVLS